LCFTIREIVGDCTNRMKLVAMVVVSRSD